MTSSTNRLSDKCQIKYNMQNDTHEEKHNNPPQGP